MDEEVHPAARQETDSTELAAPRRFETWWTIVASILIAGLGALMVFGKHGAGLRTADADPLKAFDGTVQRETSDPPLPPEVAADAERTLKALIGDGKQPTVVANGARSRLVIVLGESGRWSEVEPYLLRSDHATLVPVVTCAYGPGDKTCATLSACDDAHLATLEIYAGPWAARARARPPRAGVEMPRLRQSSTRAPRTTRAGRCGQTSSSFSAR